MNVIVSADVIAMWANLESVGVCGWDGCDACGEKTASMANLAPTLRRDLTLVHRKLLFLLS